MSVHAVWTGGVTDSSHSTLVYVDGEASMRTFEDKEGQTRSALSITQRASSLSPFSTRIRLTIQGSIEVLKRPDAAKADDSVLA